MPVLDRGIVQVRGEDRDEQRVVRSRISPLELAHSTRCVVEGVDDAAAKGHEQIGPGAEHPVEQRSGHVERRRKVGPGGYDDTRQPSHALTLVERQLRIRRAQPDRGRRRHHVRRCRRPRPRTCETTGSSAGIRAGRAGARRCAAPSALMVLVGFTAPAVTNTLPSTIARLGTSWQTPHRSTTEARGSSPILAVPSR